MGSFPNLTFEQLCQALRKQETMLGGNNTSKSTTFYENSKGNSIKKSFKYSQNKHNQNGHYKPNGIPQTKIIKIIKKRKKGLAFIAKNLIIMLKMSIPHCKSNERDL
jgi:hypothetical protein